VNERIGELLVKENLLTREQLRDARASAKGTGNRLGAEITKLGLLDESELADFVAKQYGVPSINLDEFEIDRAVIELVPEEVAIKHNVIPVNRAGSTLILATSDPSNIFALDDIMLQDFSSVNLYSPETSKGNNAIVFACGGRTPTSLSLGSDSLILDKKKIASFPGSTIFRASKENMSPPLTNSFTISPFLTAPSPLSTSTTFA